MGSPRIIADEATRRVVRVFGLIVALAGLTLWFAAASALAADAVAAGRGSRSTVPETPSDTRPPLSQP